MSAVEGEFMARLRKAARAYIEARALIQKANLQSYEGHEALRAFQAAQSEALAVVREIGEAEVMGAVAAE
jgi:hypothetical protein